MSNQAVCWYLLNCQVDHTGDSIFLNFWEVIVQNPTLKAWILSYLCSAQQALTGEPQDNIKKLTEAILTLNSGSYNTCPEIRETWQVWVHYEQSWGNIWPFINLVDEEVNSLASMPQKKDSVPWTWYWAGDRDGGRPRQWEDYVKRTNGRDKFLHFG